MFRTPTRVGRATAVVAALGASLASVSLVSAAPSQAATTLTDFGLQATAYGTLVEGGELPVASGRSAFSWIACTRKAGREASNHVAGANLSDRIEVGAVTSSNRTWKAGPEVHVASTNEVASLTIGDPAAQAGALEVKAVKADAHAWHDSSGYHARTNVTGVLVATVGSAPIETNIEQLPLIQLPGQKFEVPLPESGEFLTVPGVVTITSDWTNNAETARHAQANVNGLRVDLEGTDAMLIVARARARINGNVPSGVMSGRAFGSEARLLDGTVTSGQSAVNPLPCEGTDGKWDATSTLGSTIPGVASIGVTKSEVYGSQNRNRSGVAKTRSTVADARLGDGRVVLRAITAQANVTKSRSGTITKNSKGTSPGTITIDGQTSALPLDGTRRLGDLGKIATNEVTRSKHGIQVTAVRVTLFNGTAADSVLDLGNAWASLRPS